MTETTNKPNLTYAGVDDWSRKLFRTKSGIVLVDVDGQLYTRTPEWDEPDYPVGVPTPSTDTQEE